MIGNRDAMDIIKIAKVKDEHNRRESIVKMSFKKVRRSRSRASQSKSFSKNDPDFFGFSYRYTNYYFNEETQSFLPIEFNYYLPFKEILDKYSKGVKDGEEYENMVSLYGK